MHRTLLALGLLAAAGCQSTIDLYPGDSSVLLEKKSPDGSRTIYKLVPGRAGDPPRLVKDQRTVKERVALEIEVVDLDSDLARRFGATAWKGVYVERADADGAAGKGGLEKGDIVQELNGVQISAAKQLVEIVQRDLAPGQPVKLAGLRPVAQGDGFKLEELHLEFVPDTRKIEEYHTDTVKLETSARVSRFTGIQVAAIDSELGREIYGESAPMTLVSSVVTGSRGYMAGVRHGDRVLDVDGRGASIADFEAAVDARADGDGPPITVATSATDGSHSAAVATGDDLNRTSHLSIPIVWSHYRDVDEYEWKFLDFIVQFGASWHSNYLATDAREPAKHSELSLLPFGLFEFEFSPTSNHYSILWVIDWDTTR